MRITELALATHLSRVAAQRAIRAELGVSSVVAQKLVQTVYDRWTLESDPSEREQRRSSLRAGAEYVYRQSMGRRVPVTDERGRQRIDAQGNPITRPDPDSQTALTAIQFLARLDGLLTPDLSISIEGGISGLLSVVAPALVPGKEGLPESWVDGKAVEVPSVAALEAANPPFGGNPRGERTRSNGKSNGNGTHHDDEEDD